MPLTDLDCRNAKPRDKDWKLLDERGLYLLVRAGGTKVWRMKYQRDGRERAITFGAYPEMPLSIARARRSTVKQILLDGGDPSATPAPSDPAPAGPTFKQVATEWHEGRKDSLNPAHEQRVWSRLQRDVIPHLGHRPIGEIDAPEILEVIRKVEARGAMDISRRMRQGCGQVFRYAIANGWAKRDPAADLRGALKPKPRVRHMARLADREMPDFFRRLSRYDGERLTVLALRFTILTWVRTSETRLATWAEFEGLDGPEPLWRIPAGRMKMHREHLVPLSRQAVAVIRELEAMRCSDFVFPHDRKPRHLPMSQNTMIGAMYRMGYRGRATVHGFRGLASTVANESELWKEDWIEMQLAHDDEDEVRAAYNSALYLSPRRRMMQWWGDRMEAAADPVAAVLG